MTADARAGDSESGDGAPAGKPRRWRGIFVRVVVYVGVLLLAVIVLLPTVVSSSFAREMFVDWANGHLAEGSLQIRGWSFGWNDGMTMDGLSVLDARGSHLVDVGSVRSELTLWNVLWGDWDLGIVQVGSVDFDARVDRQGRLNVLDVFKWPLHLPATGGVIQLSNGSGTLNDGRFGDSWIFDSFDATVNIRSVREPVNYSFVLTTRLSGQPFGLVTVKGRFDPVRGAWKQSIAFNDADMSALSPLVSRYNDGVELAGRMGGMVELESDASGVRSVRGSVHVADASAGGDALSGDVVSYRLVRGLVNVSRSGGVLHVGAAVVAAATRPDRVSVSANVPKDSSGEVEDAVGMLVDRALNREKRISVAFKDGANVELVVEAPGLIGQLHNTAQKRLAATRTSH